MTDEKDLSTQEKDKKKRTRFSEKNEHQIRSERCQKTPPEGKKKAVGLGFPLKALRSGREFEEVFEAGKKFISHLFILYLMKVEKPDLRAGVCVGKSLGKAVIRNRIKRQLREILRKIVFKSGCVHIVIVARKDVCGKPFSELRSGLTGLFERACLI